MSKKRKANIVEAVSSEDAVTKRRIDEFCGKEGIQIVGFPIASKLARPGKLPALIIEAGWGFIRVKKEGSKTAS